MANSDFINTLNMVLANTYALYLKSQNYHWHVKGPSFKPTHDLLESHYTELAEAIDEIAERIVMLNGSACANFSELNNKKTLSDGNSKFDAKAMLTELANDHEEVMNTINSALSHAQEQNDEVSIGLLVDRLSWHEKSRWMLSSSI